MNLRLGFMDIMDLFEASIQLYRKHLLTFLGIVALIQIPVILFEVIIDLLFLGPALAELRGIFLLFLSDLFSNFSYQELPVPDSIPTNALITYWVSAMILLIIHTLTQYLMTCALINASAYSLKNESFGVRDAYHFKVWNFFSLILADTLQMLILFLPSVLLMSCSIGIGLATLYISPDNTFVASFWLYSILVAIIIQSLSLVFFYVRFQLVPQVIVLEDKGIIHGLRRSWQLVKGSFWKVLILMISLRMLSLIVSSIPAELVNRALTSGHNNSPERIALALAITSLIYGIGHGLWMPLQVITYTLLYKNFDKQHQQS